MTSSSWGSSCVSSTIFFAVESIGSNNARVLGRRPAWNRYGHRMSHVTKTSNSNIYIYIYLKCNHALAGKHLQKCLPNIQPILSLSLSPYFCLIFSPNLSEHFSMRFGWRPHWSHIAFQPPLFKNAKEQAKTYQGSQPGQEILQCFFIALFFKWPKKICHSTWQLLFGKLWENKTVNMESSWELRGGDDAKNLQWGTGWGQTNVELSR